MQYIPSKLTQIKVWRNLDLKNRMSAWIWINMEFVRCRKTRTLTKNWNEIALKKRMLLCIHIEYARNMHLSEHFEPIEFLNFGREFWKVYSHKKSGINKVRILVKILNFIWLMSKMQLDPILSKGRVECLQFYIKFISHSVPYIILCSWEP